VLPTRIVKDILDTKPVEPTAHTNVCTYYSDICHFTELTACIGPMEIAKLLGRINIIMDLCATRCKGVWKVENSGDSYFCEVGVVYDNGSLEANVSTILDFALLVHQYMSEITNPLTGEPLEMRVGISCGDCVASLVGNQQLMPHFCLFGDLINVTRRLESTSTPRMIQVGKAVRDVMMQWEGNANKQYVFHRRGLVDTKGKGVVETYFFLGTARNPLVLRHFTLSEQPFFSFDYDVSAVATDDASLVEATFAIFTCLVDLNLILINATTLKCYLRNLGALYNDAPYHK